VPLANWKATMETLTRGKATGLNITLAHKQAALVVGGGQRVFSPRSGDTQPLVPATKTGQVARRENTECAGFIQRDKAGVEVVGENVL